MDRQPVLEGMRFRIEPLTEHHRQPLFEVASDPLIWEQHPAKERSTRQGFDRFFDEALATDGALAIIDRSNSNMVGSSRYVLHPVDEQCVQIGWTFLSREYWGSGTNNEIKQLMIDHAFRSMQRVVLYIDLGNLRSQAAARKIGATQVTKDQYPIVFRDLPHYTTFVVESKDRI